VKSKRRRRDILVEPMNQQEHHAKRSFRGECLELLENFGVVYDPKHILKTDEK
jgi:hypothetical protein